MCEQIHFGVAAGVLYLKYETQFNGYPNSTITPLILHIFRTRKITPCEAKTTYKGPHWHNTRTITKVFRIL